MLGLTREELSQKVPGFPSYRFDQIFQWIHDKRITQFDEMGNIPKKLIEQLKKNFVLYSVKVSRVFHSKIDETTKLLFELDDSNYVEGIILKYKYGYTLCISSQVGCKMGCTFCASTKDGLVRNLSASEMIQMLYLAAKEVGEKIRHVVFMGIGEPLDNYDEVVRFIRIVTDEKGYNLSVRNITVSTCGIVEKIDRLSEEGLSVTLAVSLHSPIQQDRKKIMPVANVYDIEEVISAARRFRKKTGRRVSLEYALIEGKNSSKYFAQKLSQLIGEDDFHVNLIPVNKIEESRDIPPSKEAIASFKKVLEDEGINVTIRRELGSDISGSCGQLRIQQMKERS